MKERGTVDVCPLCGGTKQPGTTTFTAELGFGVVVIRRVPATVCVQCGTDWIADDVASQLETLVDDARRKRLQVEVVAFT
jgi:YgiT-type zinc finger domain-containing protein